jgi:hypothetical protein
MPEVSRARFQYHQDSGYSHNILWLPHLHHQIHIEWSIGEEKHYIGLPEDTAQSHIVGGLDSIV